MNVPLTYTSFCYLASCALQFGESDTRQQLQLSLLDLQTFQDIASCNSRFLSFSLQIVYTLQLTNIQTSNLNSELAGGSQDIQTVNINTANRRQVLLTMESFSLPTYVYLSLLRKLVFNIFQKMFYEGMESALTLTIFDFGALRSSVSTLPLFSGHCNMATSACNA